MMDKRLLYQTVFTVLLTLFMVSCGASKTAGIGTPVAINGLEVTVNNVHIEDELVTEDGIQKPPEATTIFVVDSRLRVLDNEQEAEINLGEIAVQGENDELLYALRGFGSSDPGEPIWLENSFGGFTVTLDPGDDLEVSLVFLINNDAIDQTFTLQFPDLEPILLSSE